jgi:hypothetical protein
MIFHFLHLINFHLTFNFIYLLVSSKFIRKFIMVLIKELNFMIFIIIIFVFINFNFILNFNLILMEFII